MSRLLCWTGKVGKTMQSLIQVLVRVFPQSSNRETRQKEAHLIKQAIACLHRSQTEASTKRSDSFCLLKTALAVLEYFYAVCISLSSDSQHVTVFNFQVFFLIGKDKKS